MSNMGLFKCETCFKTYKTKNGLILHPSSKHMVTKINIEPTQYSTSTPINVVKTVINTVSHDNLTKLLKEIQEDLSADECSAPEIRDTIKKYNFHDTDNPLLLVIKKIQEKYITENCDADEYYSVFYSDIVISCSSYFMGLRPQLCALVATRLADKVLYFSHRECNLTKVSHTNPISEKELKGLQDLPGYVEFKLLKKLKNIKNAIHLKTSILSEY